MSQSARTEDRPAVRTRTPPIPPWVFERLVNPLMLTLLRSPLHGLVSDSLLLITFMGRRSGRTYTTPAGYEDLDGTLYITSQTDRVWWKNLRSGAEVSVRLRGSRRVGHAEVIEDNEAVADYVLGFVERHGAEQVGRLALSFEGEMVPDRATLAAGLDDVVVVEIVLAEAGS